MKRLLLIAVLLIVCCGCTQHRVKDAVMRDTLFSVEETENGYYRIWMTHDDIAGYCTGDVQLGKKALNMLKEHDGEVLVYFRDIKADDPEYSWWDSSDCGDVAAYLGEDTKMFMFYELSRVSSR